jgi:hypothetical protein
MEAVSLEEAMMVCVHFLILRVEETSQRVASQRLENRVHLRHPQRPS